MPTSLFAVFLVGLVASVSSCAAMIGGLVVAVSAAAAKRAEDSPQLPLQKRGWSQRMRPHLLFNGGRLIGFAVFGALIGLVGRAFVPSPAVNGVLVVAVSLLMISLGLSLLGRWPCALVPRPPAWLARRILALESSPHPLVPFALGALTFFLPCGFTQSVQLLALSTGDPARAALLMTVFALGTLPALLGIGTAVSASRGKAMCSLTKAAGVVVIVLGIANVQNGLALIGVQFSSSSSTSPAPVVVANEQLVQMEVTPYGYQPSTLRVKAGVPVRWQVYGDQDMGCASSLVLGAFGVRQALRSGMNEILFTPTQPGTYVFSCSMGMVRGTMVVE